ncbi:CRISPR-associated Cas3 family helicase [Haloactinospora alba]|uniref:CRISPR-associated Cas3 family helicase n=1 Tax=Haloactinospora alba TaxID=405555 RepID=A0A543NLK8_9ACTN|nr:CRISPR-associated endonuclease Cas3'' [Haloactinospora alba]TQN32696.1 CRISPR-associated Cas3 family helicase [Haloactinospora alba]
MNDEEQIDLRIGAKERGLGGAVYPAICHGLDAAAVCLALWKHHVAPGLREHLARRLEVDTDTAGRIVSYWAGLHDIGKIEPYFQTKRLSLPPLSGFPAVGPSMPQGHALTGCQWLAMTLPESGYPPFGDADDSRTSLIAQVVGGHHGRYPERPQVSYDARTEFHFDEDAWDDQRNAHLQVVGTVLDQPPVPPSLDAPTAVVVTGLIVLADWLASQERFLLQQLQHLPRSGAQADLAAYFTRVRPAAEGLVADAGLEPLHMPAASFAESFPAISEPFGLQASVAEHLPGHVHGPGLLIVTAPTGEGKTEVGKYVADLMGEAAGRTGRAFLLPTTATANSMHTRVRRYAERRAAHPRPLMRLHSMAWLEQDHAPPTPGSSSDVLTGHHSAFSPTEWLYGGLRGLLASWGVGTFDQALMAVLPSRFNAVRMLGLAGKTVVVDEAHAVDPYMQKELERLLCWLGRLEVPVVLLSATLHRSVADAYARAYLEGAGVLRRPRRRGAAAPVIERLSYPGWVHVSAYEGRPRVVSNPVPIAATERSPLDVSLEAVPILEETPRGSARSRPSRTADRTEALRRLLAPVLNRGGTAAVVCTTVKEAQATYDLVRRLIDENGGGPGEGTGLHLLHARFPQWQRDEITATVLHAFGKEGAQEGARPRSAVLVATAIIEQSLDIDLDLMITDLAPMALLLQRAGRCWRHEHLGIIDRHAFTAPRVAVLVPGEPDADAMPTPWTAIHAPSLLERTHRLLQEHGACVAIPDDVQALVEQVHDNPELAQNVKREYERIGEAMAQQAQANTAVVPRPAQLADQANLSAMTLNDFSDEAVATRLGAESVRVVCCFADANGRLWADAQRTRALAGTEPGHTAPLSAQEANEVMNLTIPVPGGTWYRELSAGEAAIPPPWRKHNHLSRLLLIRQPLAESGQWSEAVLGGHIWLLDKERGLIHHPIAAGG